MSETFLSGMFLPVGAQRTFLRALLEPCEMA